MVHGLGGHALGSWKSSESCLVWLRDFLPDDIKNIRIITYGYNTSLDKTSSDWKTSYDALAVSMLESLSHVRSNDVS